MKITCNLEQKYSKEIELNAAIQLKNYINSNWKFTNDHNHNQQLIIEDDDIIIVISNEDKDYIKNNIVDSLIYFVTKENVKVLKQLNQCIKKMLKFEIDNWLEHYLSKIITCFTSGNQKQIYAGIILLHQLSKIYEYEREEKIEIYHNTVINKLNHYLVGFLEQCNNLDDIIQAQFIYKILKIFVKNIQGSIPRIYFDINNFAKWSNIISRIIKTPISKDIYQKQDTIFWKLKKICYQIITRLYNKTSNSYLVDESDKEKCNFQNLINTQYIHTYFLDIKDIYSNINNNEMFINDYCLMCIYNLFTQLIIQQTFAEEVIEAFITNSDLKAQIIRDAMLQQDEITKFKNDIKSYISKQECSIFGLFSKRYSAYKLTETILSYKQDKSSLPKYYEHFLGYFTKLLGSNEQEKKNENGIFIQNNTLTYESLKFNLVKESLMYLIAMNSRKIIKISPDLIEHIIENSIIPEFDSPIGIMREKACYFVSQYKDLIYKNEKNVTTIITKICYLMEKDPCINVKIKSASAAAAMLSQKSAQLLLKGAIKFLLSNYLKLLEETETDEIVDSIQIVIKEFKDETKEFIVQLNEYLIKFFNKIKLKESDDDKGENYSMVNNIIATLYDIIHYFVNDDTIFPQIEKHIEIILDYCIKDELFDKIEEGLDILLEIVSSENALKLSKKMWNYFIPIISSVIGTNADLEEFKKRFPNQIYEGYGFDYISTISKTVCMYIIKDPETFKNGNDGNGNNYLQTTMKLINSIIEISEGQKQYSNVIYAFKIIAVLFDAFREKIAPIHSEILQFISTRLLTQSQMYKRHLRFLLSSCFIYNASSSVKFYESTGSLLNILKFWFEGLDSLKRKKEVKYNVMGLCCLISIEPSLQSPLVIQNMKNIIEKILSLVIIESDNKDEDLNKDEIENDDNLIMEEEEEDEEEEDEDEDEDEENCKKLTNIDKQNVILFVKNTLNHIANKNQEYYRNITEIIGNKINKLNEIFKKEEELLNNFNK